MDAAAATRCSFPCKQSCRRYGTATTTPPPSSTGCPRACGSTSAPSSRRSSPSAPTTAASRACSPGAEQVAGAGHRTPAKQEQEAGGLPPRDGGAGDAGPELLRRRRGVHGEPGVRGNAAAGRVLPGRALPGRRRPEGGCLPASVVNRRGGVRRHAGREPDPLICGAQDYRDGEPGGFRPAGWFFFCASEACGRDAEGSHGLHANIPMESAGLQVHHHLLHLLHSIFFRPVFESEAPEAAPGSSKKAHPDDGGRPAGPRTLLSLLPSASELQDAGVKLKKREQRGLLDATFRDSTMQLPFLRVDRFTVSLLQNLLAWESCHAGAGSGVTVYVLFMDRLVRTGRDAAVLGEKGVLEHRLGGDGEVAWLFDGLAAGVPRDLEGGCYLKPMLQRVRKYQKSNLHKWKAWIKREFSGNEEFYLGLLLE